MSKKNRNFKAKETPDEDQGPEDSTLGAFEFDQDGVEEEPDGVRDEGREEPEPEVKEEPAEEEPAEGGAEEEPEGEESEEEIAAKEGEGEGVSASDLAAKEHAGFIRELQSLRGENRALRAKSQLQQAPSPQQQQAPPGQFPPMPGTPQQGGGPPGSIPIQFSEDGTQAYFDPTPFRQQIQDAARPDPVAVAQQQFDRDRAEFIGENSAVHGPVVTRLESAGTLMNELAEGYALKTGYVPQTFADMVDVFETTEVGTKFREHFPEITDVGEFLSDLVLGGGSGDLSQQNQSRRRYIGRYLERRGRNTPKPNGEESEELDLESRRESEVIPIQQNRPRSMAKAGKRSVSKTGDTKRMESLEKFIQENPFTSDEEEVELKALCRKLGQEYI